MNVLAKIVIPKTNVTMGYINNELEELAREEFFRLKKVLEIKRKMYGDDKKKKAKADDLPIDDQFCQACAIRFAEQKNVPIIKSFTPSVSSQKSSISSKAYTVPSRDDSMSLKVKEVEDLIRQITEIVDVTKKIDDKQLVKASFDDFIKTAEELKGKLGQRSNAEEEYSSLRSIMVTDEVDMDQICDSCRLKYDSENYNKQLLNSSLIKPERTLEKEVSKDTTSLKKSLSPSLSIENYSESELDNYETEYKEIIKIIKTKNKDGSITIKKKITKIEKEVRTPVKDRSLPSSSRVSNKSKTSQTSHCANKPYPGSKTIGVVGVPELNIFIHKIQRKVKSEMLNSFKPMTDPIERSCVSSVDLNFDLSENYRDTFVNPDWLSFEACSSAAEEILSHKHIITGRSSSSTDNKSNFINNSLNSLDKKVERH